MKLIAAAAATLLATVAQADETAQPASYPMADCNTAIGEGIPSAGWNLVWENDAIAAFSGSDEFYTQGMQFGYRWAPDAQPAWLSQPMAAICRGITAASDRSDKKQKGLVGAGSLFIGQHFFTPGDISNPALIPDDRPYAAWLYVGARLELTQLFDESTAIHQLDHTFELQFGTLGPRANGEWTQRDFHDLINDDRVPQGWDNQLPNELGIQGRYKIRALLAEGDRQAPLNYDVALDGELGVGTIQLMGSVGGILRVGRNLGSPVVDRLGPTIPLTPKTAMATVAQNQSLPSLDDQPCLSGPWIFTIQECYLFIGATGRATAFNAFLDGTLFHGGHSVDREPLTYDLLAGARIRWSRFQLDYAFVRRSREFSPVPATASNSDGHHDYGAVNVRCLAPIGAQHGHWELTCPIFFGSLLAAVFAQ